MRTHRFVTLGLFAALTCIGAFVSCGKQRIAKHTFKSDRLVTIEVSPDGASCEVDYPVTFMRMRGNAKIGWASDDNAYTVHFVAGNPFNPTINSIPVPTAAAGGKSALQTLQNSGSGGYYEYEILDANNKVCKKFDDDHDTGLNIKP